MITVPLSEAERLPHQLFQSTRDSQERVILTDDGLAVLALVPIADYQLIVESLEDQQDILDAAEALSEEGSVTIEQFIAKHGHRDGV
jgi:PHD/YefM family antitoxin component YafN of YafNO toxin-antitoxin module